MSEMVPYRSLVPEIVRNREEMLERPLPHSVEAERAILGSILLDNRLIKDARRLLVYSDFYVRAHQFVFMAMCSLDDRREEIDPLLLSEELRREGVLEQAGGMTFIGELTYGLPHFTNVAAYAEVVLGKSDTRQLIKVANRITSMCLEEEELPETLKEHARTMVLAVTDNEARLKRLAGKQDDWITLEDAAREMEEVVYPNYFHKRHTGLSTGYPELDAALGANGFDFDELIVIAGRTSFGKTTLALNLARNQAEYLLARGEGETIGFVSREMGKQRLFRRIHAMTSQIEAGLIRPGMWDKTLARLLASVREVGRLPILIDERSSTLAQLDRQLAYGVEKRKMRACYIDYIQLMAAESKRSWNRAAEVSEVARGLIELKKRYGIPLIPLSQLSRENMKEDRRPVLTDLRESGDIEQAADTVIFVHGPEAERGETLRKLQFIIAKQRDGVVHGPKDFIACELDTEMLTFHTPLFTQDFKAKSGTLDEAEIIEPGADGEDWSVN